MAKQYAYQIEPKHDNAWWVLLAHVCIKCGAPTQWFFIMKLMERNKEHD